MKKISIVILFMVGITAGLMAQSSTVAAGGNGSGDGGTLSFTVGQVVYTASKSDSGTVTAGVQQPYEIYVTGINEFPEITLKLSVYPNPVSDYLTLDIKDHDTGALTFQLYDNAGKVLLKKKVSGTMTRINMAAYVPSIYFLRVVEGDRVLKTFKIIKK